MRDTQQKMLFLHQIPPTPQVSGNPGNEKAEKVSESEGVKDTMETRELRARM